MRRVVRVVTMLAVAYLAAMLGVFALQRRLLYMPPSPEVPAIPGATLVRTETRTHLPVVAIYLPAAAGMKTVVHFHGNADQVANEHEIARSLHVLGLGFYGIEYPGFGVATGASPTEENIYAVADAALVHLREVMRVPKEQIVLQGHSLGSGVAAEMAVRGHGSWLVLVSPYTSMIDMARRVSPIFPVMLLLRDRYDTLGKASRLRLPVLILHGRQDEVIPVEMSERLAAAIAGCKLVIDEASSHNDIFGAKGYASLVADFSR